VKAVPKHFPGGELLSVTDPDSQGSESFCRIRIGMDPELDVLDPDQAPDPELEFNLCTKQFDSSHDKTVPYRSEKKTFL
jgi:hypothetical protein